MTSRLLVLVPDYVTEILAKGEYPPRYYNPGEVFDEVDLLITAPDHPPVDALQFTVGRARLRVHTLAAPRFVPLDRWSTSRWLRAGLALARSLAPTMMRCYGNFANGYLAAHLRQQLQVPLVISLHINPDVDLRGRVARAAWRRRAAYRMSLIAERRALRAADLVLPVYEAIRSYAERRGARRIRVAYNMLNGEHLRQKQDYRLHTPARVISVGRQFAEKNPEHVIRALTRLPGVHLTLVGDGPYHEHLRSVAAACGVGSRVTFHRRLPNDELCELLLAQDIFATHTEYWEFGKAVIEPLLVGLPVIVNRRRGAPVAELQGDWVRLVDNSAEAYAEAIGHLLEDSAERERLGTRAYQHARERYAPERTEQVFADIYRSLLPPA